MKKTLTFIFFIVCLSPHLMAQNIIFTEDFDGGISDDWTINPVSSGNPDSVENALWIWATNESLQVSDYWIDFYYMNSPTVENGFAIFDAAYLDSGGVDSQDPPSQGTGTAPIPLVSDLISPIIDCSDLETVVLSFNQKYYSNEGATHIGVSNDGGQSWEYIQINTNVSTLLEGTKDYQSELLIDLTEYAAAQAEFRFCFRYDGDYYYWLVDDIRLSEFPPNDLAIASVQYPLTSYAQPASQLKGDTLRFSMSVSNVGKEDQMQVVKKARVFDANGNTLYTDSLIIPSIPAGSEEMFHELPSFFLPDQLEEGDYAIRYEVYSLLNDDFTPNNNQAELPFQITENTFSKHYGDYWGAIGWPLGDFKAGNVFHTAQDMQDQTRATKAVTRVCCQPEMFGRQFEVILYEVKAEVAADWSNFAIDSDNSLIIRGFGATTLGEEEPWDDIEITLFDINTGEEGVDLNPGSRYFLVGDFKGANNQLAIQTSNKILYDGLSTAFYGAGFDQWLITGTGGFLGTPSFVPIMNLEITSDMTNATKEELPSSVLSVTPNPASDYVQISTQLPVYTPYQITLMDTKGNILQERHYTAELYNQVWKVGNLPAGLYFVRLNTDSGTRTVKLVVH